MPNNIFGKKILVFSTLINIDIKHFLNKIWLNTKFENIDHNM